MGIKLLTLNIELDRHLDRVITLLGDEKPDVICLQEASIKGFNQIKGRLGLHGRYFPMDAAYPGYEPQQEGIIYLTNLPNTNISADYYVTMNNPKEPGFESDHSLVKGIVRKDEEYLIATTHFYWSPNGTANEMQKRALTKLLKSLDGLNEYVLCGDFNAPRGREVYTTIAQRFTDNLPQEVTSTIDPKLHRAGNLELAVDTIFSTPRYYVTDVKVISGVSDHKAIVGMVQRRII